MRIGSASSETALEMDHKRKGFEMSGRGGLGWFLSALLAPQQKPDGPIPFGYKMGWIAVRSTSTAEVAASAGMRSLRSASWKEGIDAAYNNGRVFVTPPVKGWVCIIGEPMMQRNGYSSVEAISKLVASLSTKFSDAQGFASHRVIEYHHWMLARKGQLIRCFAYIGETGEVLANAGVLTDIESKLRFFKLPKERWQPSEADVMTIASAWSFDPTKLTDTSAPAALGVVGKF
jgi:hypothetical protein